MNLLLLHLLTLTTTTLASKLPQLYIIQHQGNYSEVSSFAFNGTIEHVLVFPTSQSIHPYRISAWTTKATEDLPVMVVVRQEREVLSWQLPFVVDTSRQDKKIKFYNTSRTLCHHNMPKIARTGIHSRVAMHDLSQNFIVALSTSSLRTVDVYVKVEEEKDFYIENDIPYSVAVSPSQTRYFYYKFPNNKTDSVVLEITSNDDVCLTVSIQDSYCPVFDLDKDITYEGKYQTINRKGGMSIRRKEYPDGFFLVFVAKADNYECSQEHSILPGGKSSLILIDNRTSVVDFKIVKGITGKGYSVASLVTLGAIGVFYIISISMVLAFSTWGSLRNFRKLQSEDTTDADAEEEPTVIVLTKEERKMLLREKELTVDLLARNPHVDTRRSYNYLWHILSIAIFYSIPVVQLVITYQRVVNNTGDQDMCYYNFLCAHPAFGLSDFNHIFSNIGYMLIGILFLGVILHRHALVPFNSNGIPVQYGVFYAMGIALIIEGVLSGCYHICPSQSNYQFDTSFMYMMAVLCMIKLYQNRHPDINATAYATFTVLGVAIFLAMVGILNGSLAVWIVFVLMYSFLCVYISVKIYFISYVWDGLVEFKAAFTHHGFKVDTIAPIRRQRFILLFFANIINYAMLITGLCLYDSGATDFGTFLLGLLMANSVLYAVFYTSMKLVCGERICMEAIFYGLLGIATWAFATYFFLDNATLWTVTPAKSRQLNQDCILMDFYDKHDVWHLLSAPALYFSFMFLLCLDDDLIDKRRSDLHVF